MLEYAVPEPNGSTVMVATNGVLAFALLVVRSAEKHDKFETQ